MDKVTIYDVAKTAECSTATVSLVLHNSEKVKPETRERVQEVMKRLGYTPNYLARSLSMKATNTLGLIVPQVENPVFSQMIAGVEKYASSRGYNLLLGISGLELDKENLCLNMLRQKRVDGLLIFPTFMDHILANLFHQKTATQNQIPIVFCGSSGNQDRNDISYVKCDQRMGAYLAVDHLIDTGRRRIALIAAVSEPSQASSRVAGYRDALAFHNMKADESLIRFCSQENESIYRCTQELLASEKPDAIFCLYDYMALLVMRAIHNQGLRIPEDIAVIGFDNISISQYLPVSLSTVNTRSEKVGIMAAQLLLQHIDTPDLPPQQIRLAPELIVRESTGKTPPPDGASDGDTAHGNAG